MLDGGQCKGVSVKQGVGLGFRRAFQEASSFNSPGAEKEPLRACRLSGDSRVGRAQAVRMSGGGGSSSRSRKRRGPKAGACLSEADRARGSWGAVSGVTSERSLL